MNPEVKCISKDIELYIYDLESLCLGTKKLIDSNIVEICEGDSDSSTEQVKLTFIDFLKNKDETKKIGAIAEFFVHLFLREQGYKQEFLFYNLEERSIKKGFDGYFSLGKIQFIVESKSGLESSKGILHQAKVKEAYRDISSVIEGKSKKSSKGKNNPWKNAYNHASHIDVGTSKSIRKNLKELSDLFDRGVYQKVEDFNIMPCSTIFLNEKWSDKFSKSILSESIKYFAPLKAKSVKVICITNFSYSEFINYLESDL
ncbi:hypothetical protein [Pseudoalteromonas maricaloris]|uniref:hypothetical protein n=1 Tax=Pseudoalteromonas maricaloris TaxID=184924 RepID=UPI00057F17E1|nr:hypothetical protein [Pseudoalteromonas flavipulchra]KID36219.1 hypothetical protein QT15_11410 [Pseudoalteromonas flavipulchra NCIMB 2033 = ATCC BAA-314]MBD0780389.1 hypothetical protein [Pseudoalteromonas flavipulchra]MBE0371663.1 hypothetical protein [Pseudoalteromonas flavipulchra NCIMB 2033 = ATCC BAA-314]